MFPPHPHRQLAKVSGNPGRESKPLNLRCHCQIPVAFLCLSLPCAPIFFFNFTCISLLWYSVICPFYDACTDLLPCSLSEAPWEEAAWGKERSSFVWLCPSQSGAALLFWLFSSLLPDRRQIQSSEDGFFSSSFYLRYHGHSRSAENGYQHQEPDPAQYHLAPLSPLPPGYRVQTRVCWLPVHLSLSTDP